MSATLPPLQATYTCRHCQKTFAPTDVPIIGEDQNARLARICKMLVKHLQDHHKDALSHCAILGNEFGGWVMMTQYQHTDAQLSQQAEQSRLKYRAMTRKPIPPITDEVITKQIETHLPALDEDAKGKVFKLLQTLRNSVDEAVMMPVTKEEPPK